jgi:hypothetical protein
MQQHLGVVASRFGALRRLADVVDQRSVAMRPPGQALAAVIPHAFVHSTVSAHRFLAAPRRATGAAQQRDQPDR